MKITAVQTILVNPTWLFVKLETDEGVSGFGECLGDKAAVQAAAVHSFEHYLIGQDPRRITHHWESMYRGAFWRAGPTLMAAISGLEMAMWDILGKSLGVPIYQLLGGAVRDRIRVYGRVHGEDPETLAKSAKEVLARGYTAMKFPPLIKRPTRAVDTPQLIDDVAARMQAVREAVGNDVDVMLDFHGMTSPAMAVLLEEAVRPFRPLFIEEPMPPENVGALARAVQKFTTPVATGERLVARWGFREVLEKGAASILQPDPCVCGGIAETRFIAAMAETYYVSVAPHSATGPLNLAACLHIDASTPNFLIQECIGGIMLGERGYLKEPFVIEDGYIALPDKPGLGIELDEEFLASVPFQERPDVGRWFHADDGSVADW